jgi:hypothetical protein
MDVLVEGLEFLRRFKRDSSTIITSKEYVN